MTAVCLIAHHCEHLELQCTLNQSTPWTLPPHSGNLLLSSELTSSSAICKPVNEASAAVIDHSIKGASTRSVVWSAVVDCLFALRATFNYQSWLFISDDYSLTATVVMNQSSALQIFSCTGSCFSISRQLLSTETNTVVSSVCPVCLFISFSLPA